MTREAKRLNTSSLFFFFSVGSLYLRCFLSIVLSFSFFVSLVCGARADDSRAKKIDERSGLSWETLINGEMPDESFWEFIRPQREYLRRAFGPEVSTTYELYRIEKERLEAGPTERNDPRFLEIKTLRRWPDPVIFYGRQVPAWVGERIDSLRVYACHLGKFVPIPFQVDEYTTQGNKVLQDGGPEADPQDGNGLIDPQDEFIMMAHDLGDRVRPTDWPGAWGTMMNRSLWDSHFMSQADISIRYTDDITRADPPEYYDGQIGMAYNDSTVRNLKPGLYVAELDWFFPPWFNPPEREGALNSEKVKAYLDMYDNPLLISTGGGWFSNQPRPKGSHPVPPEDSPYGTP